MLLSRDLLALYTVKSLDYEIHPCISYYVPAFGCSNLLQADLVPLKTCGNDEDFKQFDFSLRALCYCINSSLTACNTSELNGF